MLSSQAIQDSRGTVYGLLGDLEGFENQIFGALRFAFAVEAGYGLAFLERVSWLYEDFDTGAGVDPVAFFLRPAPRTRAALPMPDASKRAT